MLQTCITTLGLRNLMRPFKDGMMEQSCPMTDIFRELTASLEELKAFKEQNDFDIAPA